MSELCCVCDSKMHEPIYQTAKDLSITSLCEVVPVSTCVYFCEQCGHTQTSVLGNLDEYYSDNYKILIDTEEEDQMVSFPDGRKAFRFELQVETIFDKLKIPKNAKVLDYGCAKSTTLKKMCEKRGDINPYLFDVSELYLPFWEKITTSENWAVFEPKAEWQSSFDVITSFFALEHVSEPVSMMENICTLLKDEGYFYCIIPDMYANIADFVVADHVNHFSVNSLHKLFSRTGFEVVEIDRSSHYGAFIIVAKKSSSGDISLTDSVVGNELTEQVKSISDYWGKITKSIKEFEAEEGSKITNAAIYGSGFYGTYIASCLSDLDKVKLFIDQNPHRQGLQLLGKNILSPEQLPNDIQLLYVGLNPIVAQKAISSVECLQGRDIHFYFL